MIKHNSDQLLNCLILVAKTYGFSPTRASILAGLPVAENFLTPTVFSRAAKKTGLESHLVYATMDDLKSVHSPIILLLTSERACIVLKFNPEKDIFLVNFPETGDAQVEINTDDLCKNYIGMAFLIQTANKLEPRAQTDNTKINTHWFWGVISENKQLYRDVLIAALFTNFLALGMPLFTMNVYDRVVPNHAFDTLWMLSIGMVLFFVSEFILRVLRGKFVDLASARSDVKISANIMERVLGTRMEQRPISAGSFASNLKSFESIRDFIGSATVIAFIDFPFAIIFIIALSWISIWMLIPIFLGISISIFYSLAVQQRMHELSQTTFQASAQRNATLIESLIGFETIKALSAESIIQRKWEQSATMLAQVGNQLRLLSSTANLSTALIQQFITLVMVIIGVYLISTGNLSMGGLIASTMLAARTMAPLSQVTSLLVQYHTASTALTSLNKVMESEIEHPENAQFLSRGPYSGAIEFKDVSFRYPGQESNQLHKISFKINAGEKIAILGRIGSGKSTLEKLILGLFQPTEGSVLLDGIDLRQLNLTEHRHQIGYVPQDILLFYGNLRDNIMMGATAFSESNLIKAANISGISELVNTHPKGFDMMIGERGESLSGGQRQGVAIARALINDPPILLLDEPTSSMDYSSEDVIKNNLKKFSESKTLVLISHRTTLLDLADRIIVIDGGRIVADGPKEQVVHALRQGRIGKAS